MYKTHVGSPLVSPNPVATFGNGSPEGSLSYRALNNTSTYWKKHMQQNMKMERYMSSEKM